MADAFTGQDGVISSTGEDRAGAAAGRFYTDELSNTARGHVSRANIDVSEIELCRKASLNRVRELLKQKDTFDQAALLVLLEHFRPEFFAVGQQLITQGAVDLSRAAGLVEGLNAALMFCSDRYYHVDDPAERAIIKYYLLKIVKGASGIVNLRGQYHGGWISVTGVATNPDGAILKIMVQVNPFRAPHAMYRYYDP
jgi:hypothetical protein